MIEVINNFRSQNGKGYVVNWDNVVSQYCTEHCWAIVRAGHLYHAESCYLNGWAEIVAMKSRDSDWRDTENNLIFDVLGKSNCHRNILLDYDIMAYGIIEWQLRVYLTIRARK